MAALTTRTEYPVIAEPPLAGAVQRTRAEAFPAVAVLISGARGTVADGLPGGGGGGGGGGPGVDGNHQVGAAQPTHRSQVIGHATGHQGVSRRRQRHHNLRTRRP
ncbi:MAG: hypothetical protein ABIP19_15575 [Dermatophilaceae bacterium]